VNYALGTVSFNILHTYPFIIVCFVHSVHEVNTHRASHVCLHDSAEELLDCFG
jgi:hypothetical protein